MSFARDFPEMLDPEPDTVQVVQMDDRVGFPVRICRSDSDRIASAERLIRGLKEEFNGLEAYVVLKNAESIINIGLEIAKDAAIGKLNSKEETVMGIKVNQRRSVEYEYEHPRLKEIEAEMAKLKEEKKQLETLLQNMTEPMAYGSTGEMIQPAKKIKDGVNIAVTLPK